MRLLRSDTGFTASKSASSWLSALHPRLSPGRCGALLAMLVATGGCTGSPADAPPLPPLPERTDAAQAGLPAGTPRPVRELGIALTGEVRGEIEPCGCPTLPYGGFERRQRLLDQLRTTQGPMFQLDAGELLAKGVSHYRGNLAERAQAVLDLSAEVGVQAWVPGPSDLVALDLAALRARRSPTTLSATWTDPDGALLFPPSTVVEADGLRIGVVGLSAEPLAPETAALVQFRDPVDAARDALATLPADLDLVVGLGSVADADADRVAREVPGFAALLTTNGGRYDDPRTVDGVLIVETPDRGRYLQVLTAVLGSTADQPLELRLPAARLHSLRQLRNKAAAAADDADAAEALEQAQALLAADAAGRNLAWLDTRPLAEDLDGEAAVTSRLEAFKDDVLQEAARRAAAPPPPQGAAYATAAACTNCHLDEFARWSFSDHAQAAWQSLVGRDATRNAECLPCHTTGFGEPGGLGEINELGIRRFKAVQCEECHGPMAGHPDDPSVRGDPITPDTCTGCHDEANSPDFDFATYLPRGSCQAATAPHGGGDAGLEGGSEAGGG